MFFEVGKKSGCLMGAFLHSTIRGQAHGGVRYWPYATMGALQARRLLCYFVDRFIIFSVFFSFFFFFLGLTCVV
jgi:hypothetical protein